MRNIIIQIAFLSQTLFYNKQKYKALPKIEIYRKSENELSKNFYVLKKLYGNLVGSKCIASIFFQ